MTMNKTHQRRLFIIIAIACLAGLLGMWSQYNLHTNKTPTLKTATIFPEPRIISSFELIDDENKPFTLENLKGHFSLIFFGFTHCPDLCPTTLATLNKSYKILENAKLKNLPQILFISVDPEQDDPKTIKKYLNSFNTAFLGATGNKKQLDKLTQELSVLYTKVVQPEDKKHYSIDHSGAIILINSQGQFYGVFTIPHDAQKIADDMKILLGQG